MRSGQARLARGGISRLSTCPDVNRGSLTAAVSDMRASRLVSIILLRQARGQMPAGQLAAELEVSVRTIYRDVGSLQAAGIPLYGDAGPAGGYQLVAGYRTRLTGMTAAE